MEGNETGRWALLIDGSSLFFGQRQLMGEEKLDYVSLSQILSEQVQANTPPKPAIFFTASDDKNEGQQRFHKLLEDIGWDVQQCASEDAQIINKMFSVMRDRIIRFDTMLAYCLGRLRCNDEIQEVVIVSDTFTLHQPVIDCMLRNNPIKVCVAYFDRLLDARWEHIGKEAIEKGWPLSFLDIEDAMKKYRSQPRQRQRAAISDL